MRWFKKSPQKKQNKTHLNTDKEIEDFISLMEKTNKRRATIHVDVNKFHEVAREMSFKTGYFTSCYFANNEMWATLEKNNKILPAIIIFNGKRKNE